MKLSVDKMTFRAPAVFKLSTVTRKHLCCPNWNWGGGKAEKSKEETLTQDP